MKKIEIFDSTLRDGAQGGGINFSVTDKINIVKALDNLGVDYIEAGNPFSNPKDLEFFERIQNYSLRHARLVAFGSTRRCGIGVREDKNVQALISAGTEYVAIFGKSWDLHVTEIIRTSLEENLRMIYDTVEYFSSHDKKVVFDAEHFFDGYKANPEYALATLRAAENAGAVCVTLCDTNGGCFPEEIGRITETVCGQLRVQVGIHCHDDMGCAVANSLLAVEAGAGMVQGTYLGFGERCGNANLSSIIPSLQIKKGYACIPDDKLEIMTKAAHYIAEVGNLTVRGSMPYVGSSAFAHKGGMHVDGVNKLSRSFEHIEPQTVGNKRDFLLSEVAGRSAIIRRIHEVDSSVRKDSPQIAALLQTVKELEYRGYQFESADASFKILVLKTLGRFKEFFRLEDFKIIGEPLRGENTNSATAVIKIWVGDRLEVTAAEGEGPVHALDCALRKALEVFYPSIADVRLIDYKVRVVEHKRATAAQVRVLIETTDGDSVWTTVGASTDIIHASWEALVDSIEYKLMKDQKGVN